MAFTEDDLLLSADKSAQLTKALSNAGVADPLQYFCDEAAATVARMTTGYILDDLSVRGLTRAVALFEAYSKAGPVPLDVKSAYDKAEAELEAIATGKRPNLPRANTGTNTPSGASGSKVYVSGRMDPTA